MRGAWRISLAGLPQHPGIFPLPVLVPVTRPEALRSVPENVPDGLKLPEALPVGRPEASRYWASARCGTGKSLRMASQPSESSKPSVRDEADIRRNETVAGSSASLHL